VSSDPAAHGSAFDRVGALQDGFLHGVAKCATYIANPPPTIQLQGRAEIVDWTDEEGTDVFRRFWMGRRILRAYQESHRRGETRICFLKITPDPVVRTYMLGYRIWELRKRMESGAAKVVNPTE